MFLEQKNTWFLVIKVTKHNGKCLAFFQFLSLPYLDPNVPLSINDDNNGDFWPNKNKKIYMK